MSPRLSFLITIILFSSLIVAQNTHVLTSIENMKPRFTVYPATPLSNYGYQLDPRENDETTYEINDLVHKNIVFFAAKNNHPEIYVMDNSTNMELSLHTVNGAVGMVTELKRDTPKGMITLSVLMESNRLIHISFHETAPKPFVLESDYIMAKNIVGKSFWLAQQSWYSKDKNGHVTIEQAPQFMPTSIKKVELSGNLFAPFAAYISDEHFVEFALTPLFNLQEHFGLTTVLLTKDLFFGMLPEVKEAIRKNKLVAGMTEEEVVMSWGPPTSMTMEPNDYEYWYYNEKFVRFINERVDVFSPH